MNHTISLFYFVFFLAGHDMFPLLREPYFPMTWLDFCGRIGETKILQIGRKKYSKYSLLLVIWYTHEEDVKKDG